MFYFQIKRKEDLNHAKNALTTGLSTIDQTRQFYANQLETLDTQIKILDDASTDHTKLHMNCNVNAINSLNGYLNNWLKMPNSHVAKENFEPKGFDENLEMQRRIERLQEQNRQLTGEISRQSNRVTALEHDKRSLIKQLFQSTSTNSITSNASTLR